MSDWHDELRRRLQGLRISPEREAEIVDELAQHLQDRETELRRNGTSAAEARQKALDEVSETAVMRRELAQLRQAQAADAPPPGAPSPRRVASLWQDVRFGIRPLRQNPGFTVAAILALALGIGANSAVFAAVDAVLLRPMPFPHADRLYVPVSVNTARKIDQGSVTYADYTDWRAQKDIFAAVAVWRPTGVDLTGDGDPERIDIAQVSEEFFQVMDVTPIAGRTLRRADHDGSAPRVAVISYGLWQRRYGGRDVIGATIRMAGVPIEVVGVLPAGAIWPDTAQLFVAIKPSAFSDDVRTRRDNMIFNAVARLADGVAPETARARVAALAARVAEAEPNIRTGWTAALLSLRDYMVDADLELALFMLLGAVGAVLLIACANVANLALVRGSGRARELALRLSLGANRWRLIQQLVVESLLLAAGGVVAGVALAALLMRGLVAIAPDGTPFLDAMHLDLRLLGATAVIGTVAALASGLIPAWANSAIRLGQALREGASGTGASRGAARVRHLLIVGEIATAVVLLTSAALFIRSFMRLNHVDPGVELDRVISARLSIPTARYRDNAARAVFVDRIATALSIVPEIESAALASFVPAGAGGFGLGRVFLQEGQAEPPASQDVAGQWNVITPDYFRTVGIRVRQGRAFDARDTAAGTPVIIVSESFARRMFPEGHAVGHRIRSWRDENVLREIVGVVSDVKYTGLADRERATIYVPHPQDSWGALLVVARSRQGDPSALAPALRRIIGSLDPNLALAEVRPLAESARKSVAGQRSAMLLLSILAAVSLGLSVLGIYGVTSYAFALRRREMGIRLALGATRAHLYGIVMGHGLKLTLIGLAIGLVGAALVTRLLKSLLFNTSPADASAWTGMVVTILVFTCLACLLPARRAAGADPGRALRAD